MSGKIAKHVAELASKVLKTQEKWMCNTIRRVDRKTFDKWEFSMDSGDEDRARRHLLDGGWRIVDDAMRNIMELWRNDKFVSGLEAKWPKDPAQAKSSIRVEEYLDISKLKAEKA